MKKILFLFLVAWPVIAAQTVYRFQYTFQADAVSRILIFFPFRFYYEASAAIDFSVEPQPDGRSLYTSLSLPCSAYILRTLGFSGRSAILVAVDTELGRSQAFAGEKMESWKKEVPKYSKKAKNTYSVQRRLVDELKGALLFYRTSDGLHQQAAAMMRTEPVSPSGRHEYYFNVFPLMVEMLRLYDHSFMPEGAGDSFPESWESGPLNLTGVLSRLSTLIEKSLEEFVTIEQGKSFRLSYGLAAASDSEWQIEGIAFPQVPIWKGFKIKEYRRSVRLRKSDRSVVSDVIFVDLRNAKGQGGYGKMELSRIER